jgi:hypothetical protein
MVRLLTWSEGCFEFHASLDSVGESEEPMPVEATLLEAVRLLDEGERIDHSRLPDAAQPRIAKQAVEETDLSKVEATVLDLVRAGFTVQRMVDVIPEPDAAIYRALVTLVECGAISV